MNVQCARSDCRHELFYIHASNTMATCRNCGLTYTIGGMEEISKLDMDLLTVLSRIYQARHLIERIDPMAERILTCDAPRLAGHVTPAGLAWCERTDLDTAFPEWLREIRK